MLPNPLHPAVVHFPIVLAFLLPLFAIGALVAIRKGARPLRAWSLPLAVGAALTLSSWIAVETGEDQDERVERVVAERRLLRDVPPDHVDRVLALLAGYLLSHADDPVPPTSPHLRAAQRWQGEAVWDWLCERRGWR